ncbi:MAG: ATP synthase F1 subunit gamma [Anaerolineaceae bacterium 4572_32.2]|nr:MAG: ATP synthase F1 subunit gamma [Anaerolineaceae bacterium 4572_32.2]RLC75374.1 MAG: ATP synthase F1 subunit gamma [Chloroflexota bacterium]HEY72290.1 ATP synthase F1 subunit gamma [Thermoflexia bacterium]
MATAREIKRRIQSIRNLGQVTRALQAVAASNVRKAQAAALATRAYSNAAWEVIARLGAASDEALHPLLTRRAPVENVLIVLVSGDRGLCGAYNQNIVRVAQNFVKRRDLPIRYITVGRRGRDMIWRAGAEIVAEFHGLPAVPSLVDVSAIARAAIDEFLEGRADEVYLARTDFINLLRQNPVIQRLLPLHTAELGGLEETQAMAEYIVDVRPTQVAEYIYEPDAATVLNEILPRFTELQVYQAMLEAHASEYAARMVAMRNATDNAAVLVDDLTLDYNKARQSIITSELLDIVGGAVVPA